MKILQTETFENLIMKFFQKSTYLSKWTIYREIEFIKTLLIFCDYLKLLGSVKKSSWTTVDNLIKESSIKNGKVIFPPKFPALNPNLCIKENTELLKLVTIFEQEWGNIISIAEMGFEKKYFCITKDGIVFTIYVKYINCIRDENAANLTPLDVTKEFVTEIFIEEYDLTTVDNNLKKLLKKFRNSQKGKKVNKRFFLKEFIHTLMSEITRLEPFSNWAKLHKNLAQLNANLLPHKKAAK